MRTNSVNNRCRIAVFTHDSKIWALPTWDKTLPVLMKNHDVVCMYVFPEKLKGDTTGNRTRYLRTFGVCNFVILVFFAIKSKLRNFVLKIGTWKQLCSKYNLTLKFGEDPNQLSVRNWVVENSIDVVVIMLVDIIKGRIIDAPRIGIVNKHASILPSCKGLFPYFWAKMYDFPTGVTFYKVDRNIDSGKILVQKSYPPKQSSNISVLRFYIDIFGMYPELLLKAVDALVEAKYSNVILPVEPSYYSFPDRRDYLKFRQKGEVFASWADLFYSSHC